MWWWWGRSLGRPFQSFKNLRRQPGRTLVFAKSVAFTSILIFPLHKYAIVYVRTHRGVSLHLLSSWVSMV